MLNISVIIIIIAAGLFLLAAALIILGKMRSRRIMLRQKSHDGDVTSGSEPNGATDNRLEIGQSGYTTSLSYPPAAYTPLASATRGDGYFSAPGGASEYADTKRG